MTVGRLHCLTDVLLQSRFDHAELAAMMARGGADVVQLRDKRGVDPDEWRRVIDQVLRAVDGQAKVIINDDVEAVVEFGAAGVHVGRHDAPIAEARRRLGNGRLIGRTANGLAEAVEQAAHGPDYLGVGPVFGTRSKANPAPRLGLDGLARIVAAVDVPVVAIGGVGADSVAELFAAGAHGLAVLSEVVCTNDPERAVARLRDQVDRALKDLPASGDPR